MVPKLCFWILNWQIWYVYIHTDRILQLKSFRSFILGLNCKYHFEHSRMQEYFHLSHVAENSLYTENMWTFYHMRESWLKVYNCRLWIYIYFSSVRKKPMFLPTRKHSRRMRTAHFCGSGGGDPTTRYPDPHPVTVPSRYRNSPSPESLNPPIPYLPRYPTPILKGHGTRDQEGTWDHRYPPPPPTEWQRPLITLPSGNFVEQWRIQYTILPNFPQKLKEIEGIWTPGARPLRPP